MLSERPTHPREPPGRQPTGEIEQDAASKEPTPERANVKTIPKRGLAEMRQRMTNACITRVKRWGPLRSPQPLQGTRCNASLSCSVFPSCLPAPCRWPASPTMMGNHHGGGAAYALEAAAQSVTSALQLPAGNAQTCWPSSAAAPGRSKGRSLRRRKGFACCR